jgi:hypothetical protein
MLAELQTLNEDWIRALTAFEDDHRCVMVCARVRGAWQIVFEQCTPNCA